MIMDMRARRYQDKEAVDMGYHNDDAGMTDTIIALHVHPS
jgi:hypothetical protein